MVGGQKEALSQLWKDWRIKLYIVVLIFGLASLLFFGLDFGMDFRGGTMIQLQLDEPVDPSAMSTMVTVLSERLNGFGLKDISVRPFGNEYITVEISASDANTIEQLKNLLSQQGSFEAIIDGEPVLFSDDITAVTTNPQQGYGYITSTQKWQVPFSISREGSERFAMAAKGKCDESGDCSRIYMFIDRPKNASIVVPTALYEAESEMRIDPSNPGSYPIGIEEFKANALVPIYTSDSLTPELLEEISQFRTVILPEGKYDTTLLSNERVLEIGEADQRTYWLWRATNLESVLFLTPGVTTGEPIREASITGGAPNIEEALMDMTHLVVVLRSGRLPVGLSIASTNSVSPTLGENFLNDSILMGILAIIAVAAIIFFRYRDKKLTALMMTANVSEVLVILGITALIRHQLDIASVAGIIASVGIGIDQFIIIADEVKGTATTDESESVVSRIKMAFKIIMASAATMVAAMLPLMTLGLGLLKGFAITTLIGLFIGVLIVRPAFAKALEKFSK